jgi:hypothetical protein
MKVYTKVIKTKQRGFALFRQRECNTEKRKRFNLREMEKMFVIKRKHRALYMRERVDNVGLEAILITESKFVFV